MIDFTLSSEQKALQELARDFTRKEIVPIALQYDKDPFNPETILKKAHAAGVMNMIIPKAYGGHGLHLLDASLMTGELNAGCSGIAGMISINALACGPILVGGSDEQKKRFLSPLCESGKTASFALTEREAGSDAAGVKTKAVRKGDEYVINGQKCFITNGAYAALYTVFASTDPARGTKGITAFVVPCETPGVSIGKIEDKMGQRALNVAEVNFDDVVVPATNVLGAEGQGFKIAMETLNEGRVNIATTALGIARSAFEESLHYAKQRVQFGKAIGTYQSINFLLADMAAAIDASRLLTWYAASRCDQGLSFVRGAAQAKLFASDTAMWITTDAVQIHGGYGYIKEYLVEKLMRDAKLTQIYEGTNQVNRIVAGGALMR